MSDAADYHKEMTATWPSVPPGSHRCGHCKKAAKQVCSSCCLVYYCSVECQSADRARHRKICKPEDRRAEVIKFGEQMKAAVESTADAASTAVGMPKTSYHASRRPSVKTEGVAEVDVVKTNVRHAQELRTSARQERAKEGRAGIKPEFKEAVRSASDLAEAMVGTNDVAHVTATVPTIAHITSTLTSQRNVAALIDLTVEASALADSVGDSLGFGETGALAAETTAEQEADAESATRAAEMLAPADKQPANPVAGAHAAAQAAAKLARVSAAEAADRVGVVASAAAAATADPNAAPSPAANPAESVTWFRSSVLKMQTLWAKLSQFMAPADPGLLGAAEGALAGYVGVETGPARLTPAEVGMRATVTKLDFFASLLATVAHHVGTMTRSAWVLVSSYISPIIAAAKAFLMGAWSWIVAFKNVVADLFVSPLASYMQAIMAIAAKTQDAGANVGAGTDTDTDKDSDTNIWNNGTFRSISALPLTIIVSVFKMLTLADAWDNRFSVELDNRVITAYQASVAEATYLGTTMAEAAKSVYETCRAVFRAAVENPRDVNEIRAAADKIPEANQAQAEVASKHPYLRFLVDPAQSLLVGVLKGILSLGICVFGYVFNLLLGCVRGVLSALRSTIVKFKNALFGMSREEAIVQRVSNIRTLISMDGQSYSLMGKSIDAALTEFLNARKQIQEAANKRKMNAMFTRSVYEAMRSARYAALTTIDVTQAMLMVSAFQRGTPAWQQICDLANEHSKTAEVDSILNADEYEQIERLVDNLARKVLDTAKEQYLHSPEILFPNVYGNTELNTQFKELRAIGANYVGELKGLSGRAIVVAGSTLAMTCFLWFLYTSACTALLKKAEDKILKATDEGSRAAVKNARGVAAANAAANPGSPPVEPTYGESEQLMKFTETPSEKTLAELERVVGADRAKRATAAFQRNPTRDELATGVQPSSETATKAYAFWGAVSEAMQWKPPPPPPPGPGTMGEKLSTFITGLSNVLLPSGGFETLVLGNKHVNEFIQRMAAGHAAWQAALEAELASQNTSSAGFIGGLEGLLVSGTINVVNWGFTKFGELVPFGTYVPGAITALMNAERFYNKRYITGTLMLLTNVLIIYCSAGTALPAVLLLSKLLGIFLKGMTLGNYVGLVVLLCDMLVTPTVEQPTNTPNAPSATAGAASNAARPSQTW